MIGFGPINLSRTGEVCSKGKALCPTVLEMEGVRTSYIQGVHRYERNLVPAIILVFSGIVLHEGGMSIAIACVELEMSVEVSNQVGF